MQLVGSVALVLHLFGSFTLMLNLAQVAGTVTISLSLTPKDIEAVVKCPYKIINVRDSLV